VTSDAGALLLGATDRAIRMMHRVALCFHDERRPNISSMRSRPWSVNGYSGSRSATRSQRHDELRHDPMMAILADKLAASARRCTPVAASRR